MSKKYYDKLLSDIQNQSKPVESKFGSYILKKFGWEKGKGLGKHENGEVNIMKIKKYGEHGLGYNEHEEENEKWWENMYNNCAKNIKKINNNKNLFSGREDNLHSSSDNKIQNDKNENIKYSIFIKKDNSTISTNNQESSICNLEKKKNLIVIDNKGTDNKKKIKIKNKEINKKRNYEQIIDKNNTFNKNVLNEIKSEGITNNNGKITIKKKNKKINKEINDTENLNGKKELKIKKKEKKKKKKKRKKEKKKKRLTDEM
ncbi:conserved Plasmodium protein, unknown function [Plasmodium gallinaceum]|uniref:G-patch domain-containing protein n=1 Tax=Plasmodium gallinaceum TaxID=5849 RepID=A0A1J1GYR7_PLAGA|nr:conserved Plasmodium protein, unknown function [Plasmodium gallinaceum]CRG96155.1 conserved Plasmodium protein, unknown function [Plasmodium gallinaceum]